MSSKVARPFGRKRVCTTKVKTGCQTCKIRRVKCDETSPACRRCTSTGRKCDGYTASRELRSLTRGAAVALPAPEGSFNVHAGNPDELRYLAFYFHRAGRRLAGELDADFWLHIVPQLEQAEPAIRHCITAIGYLYENEFDKRCRGDEAARYDAGEGFVIRQYNKAIGSLLARMDREPGAVEIFLVACILFICLEYLRGARQPSCGFEEAQQHLDNGLNLLSGLDDKRLHSATAASSASIRPVICAGGGRLTSSFLRDQIVSVFVRLGINANLAGQPTPQLYPLCFLDDFRVPERFSSFWSARECLVDLGSLASRYIHAAVTEKRSCFPTSQSRDSVDLSHILGHTYSQQPYSDTLTTHDIAYQQRVLAHLRDWATAFDRLEHAHPDVPATVSHTLRINHAIARVWLACCAAPSERAYDAFLPALRDDVVARAERFCAAAPDAASDRPDFTFDTQIIAPLYFAAFRCRHPVVRRRALALLRRLRRREGPRGTKPTVVVVERIIELEEAEMAEVEGEDGAEWWPAESARLSEAVFMKVDLPMVHVMFLSLPDHRRGTPGRVWDEYLQCETSDSH